MTGTSASLVAVTPVTGARVFNLTVSDGDLAAHVGVIGLDLAVTQNVADGAGNPLPSGEPAIDETNSRLRQADLLMTPTDGRTTVEPGEVLDSLILVTNVAATLCCDVAGFRAAVPQGLRLIVRQTGQFFARGSLLRVAASTLARRGPVRRGRCLQRRGDRCAEGGAVERIVGAA